MKALAVFLVLICAAFTAGGAETPVFVSWLIGCRQEDKPVDSRTPVRNAQVCIVIEGKLCRSIRTVPVVGWVSQESLEQLISQLNERRHLLKSVAIENQIAYVYFQDGIRSTRAYVPTTEGWQYHSLACTPVVLD